MNQSLPIVELLAPARDYGVGRAAIDAGADAVYIGAERFSARGSAANSLAEIEKLCTYAHLYGVRVFLALNTLLHADEIAAAKELALGAIAAGVDAIIFQDPAVLDMELPVELHASTQTAIRSVERALELQRAGATRIVLERGLTLEQIREICEAVEVEVEVFVHGAICVGNSGECYLSEHLCGRSGNRGECAQSCRNRYDLLGADGEVILSDQTLLGVKDLSLAEQLTELIDAGVHSLKIEGRLKDENYITNVVSYYNSKLREMGVKRSSWGVSEPIGFTPNPNRTFNRGFTQWFLGGTPNKSQRAAAAEELVGEVSRVGQSFVEIRSSGVELHNGDGLCYTLPSGETKGIRLNRVEGSRLHLRGDGGLSVGAKLYRNHCEKFSPKAARHLEATISMWHDGQNCYLSASTPEGCKTRITIDSDTPTAKNLERARAMLSEGLGKSGGTIFRVQSVRIECADAVPFLSSAQINALRRALLEELETQYQRKWGSGKKNRDAKGLLHKASSAGVSPLSRSTLMSTPYCILRESGLCLQEQRDYRPPFYLHNNGRKIALEFDCARCQMHLKAL